MADHRVMFQMWVAVIIAIMALAEASLVYYPPMGQVDVQNVLNPMNLCERLCGQCGCLGLFVADDVCQCSCDVRGCDQGYNNCTMGMLQVCDDSQFDCELPEEGQQEYGLRTRDARGHKCLECHEGCDDHHDHDCDHEDKGCHDGCGEKKCFCCKKHKKHKHKKCGKKKHGRKIRIKIKGKLPDCCYFNQHHDHGHQEEYHAPEQPYVPEEPVHEEVPPEAPASYEPEPDCDKSKAKPYSEPEAPYVEPEAPRKCCQSSSDIHCDNCHIYHGGNQGHGQASHEGGSSGYSEGGSSGYSGGGSSGYSGGGSSGYSGGGSSGFSGGESSGYSGGGSSGYSGGGSFGHSGGGSFGHSGGGYSGYSGGGSSGYSGGGSSGYSGGGSFGHSGGHNSGPYAGPVFAYGPPVYIPTYSNNYRMPAEINHPPIQEEPRPAEIKKAQPSFRSADTERSYSGDDGDGYGASDSHVLEYSHHKVTIPSGHLKPIIEKFLDHPPPASHPIDLTIYNQVVTRQLYDDGKASSYGTDSFQPQMQPHRDYYEAPTYENSAQTFPLNAPSYAPKNYLPVSPPSGAYVAPSYQAQPYYSGPDSGPQVQEGSYTKAYEDAVGSKLRSAMAAAASEQPSQMQMNAWKAAAATGRSAFRMQDASGSGCQQGQGRFYKK